MKRVIAIVLFTAAFGGMWACSSDDPAGPEIPDITLYDFAYVSIEGNTEEIFFKSDTDTIPFQVTDINLSITDLFWIPDTDILLFLEKHGTVDALYSYDIGQQQFKRLTDYSYNILDYKIAADNQTVAVFSQVADNEKEVSVVTVGEYGKTVVAEVFTTNNSISWSDDGDILYCDGDTLSETICAVSPGGGDADMISGAYLWPKFPVMSHTSNDIYYYEAVDGGDEGIFKINSDGTNRTLVANATGVGEIVMSLHEDKMLFTAHESSEYRSLFILDITTNDVTKLSDVGIEVSNPVFSEDYSQVLFQGIEYDGHINTSEIYIVNSDGTGLVNLTDNDVFDGFPCWK